MLAVVLRVVNQISGPSFVSLIILESSLVGGLLIGLTVFLEVTYAKTPHERRKAANHLLYVAVVLTLAEK